MMTILNVHIIYIAFMYIYKKVETKIIVCTPPFLLEGRGGVNLQPNFQKGGFTGPQLLEEGCWERLWQLFSGGGAILAQK